MQTHTKCSERRVVVWPVQALARSSYGNSCWSCYPIRLMPPASPGRAPTASSNSPIQMRWRVDGANASRNPTWTTTSSVEPCGEFCFDFFALLICFVPKMRRKFEWWVTATASKAAGGGRAAAVESTPNNGPFCGSHSILAASVESRGLSCQLFKRISLMRKWVTWMAQQGNLATRKLSDCHW